MRVVDTSAWIEWLRDSELGRRLQAELPANERWVVPTIVQFERARWLTCEVSEEAADQAIAFSMQCIVAPLDTRLALRAAEIAHDNSLAMADAIVYATTIESGADLLTCDSHFMGMAQVAYFAKGVG
jgi:predicted nucleic acid-binding protein